MIGIKTKSQPPYSNCEVKGLMPGHRKNPRQWTPVNLVSFSGRNGRLGTPWRYIVSNAACYPPEIFTQVMLEFVFHPERNSKNIRRADILSDADTVLDASVYAERGIQQMVCTRSIRRRLMPRNPNLDSELEQTCRLYVAEGDTSPTVVTYESYFLKEAAVPYYVPDVLSIAFELYQGDVYLAYLPLPNTSCEDDRMQRVALNLLRTLHRHWYNI